MDQSLAPGFLVAAPQLLDPNFSRTVVFLIEHSDDEGSLGMVINRRASVTLSDVLEELGIRPADTVGGRTRPVLYGGPVSPERGWILHSPDWSGPQTQRVTDEISITASLDVVRALAEGHGPARHCFLLGYAGWGPGQLTEELRAGAWITVPYAADLVFDVDLDDRWRAALERLGIDPEKLAATYGDA